MVAPECRDGVPSRAADARAGSRERSQRAVRRAPCVLAQVSGDPALVHEHRENCIENVDRQAGSNLHVFSQFSDLALQFRNPLVRGLHTFSPAGFAARRMNGDGEGGKLSPELASIA